MLGPVSSWAIGCVWTLAQPAIDIATIARTPKMAASSRAMPSLKDKFPTFHDWGKSLLSEIYTDEKLEQSLQLSVTELASGVFRNDGRGHFTFEALPRIAQTAPGFGLAAADLNGDGFVDLFVGQKIDVLGKPTTLMQANHGTLMWLEYHARRLLKKALELEDARIAQHGSGHGT